MTIKIIKRIYMLLTGGFMHTFNFIKRKKHLKEIFTLEVSGGL